MATFMKHKREDYGRGRSEFVVRRSSEHSCSCQVNEADTKSMVMTKKKTGDTAMHASELTKSLSSDMRSYVFERKETKIDIETKTKTKPRFHCMMSVDLAPGRRAAQARNQMATTQCFTFPGPLYSFAMLCYICVQRKSTEVPSVTHYPVRPCHAFRLLSELQLITPHMQSPYRYSLPGTYSVTMIIALTPIPKDQSHSHIPLPLFTENLSSLSLFTNIVSAQTSF
jgi:hypothetical protein